MSNKYYKYEFDGIFKCGHKGTIKQGGYTRDYAESIASKEFKDNVCPDCIEKEKQAQYKKEADIAEENAKKLGFPDLEGTDKQVQWALNIRKELSEKAQNIIDNAEDKELRYLKQIYKDYFYEDDDSLKIRVDLRESLEELLKEKTSSTFFINYNWKIKNLNTEAIIVITKDFLPKIKNKIEKEKEEKAREEELKRDQTIHPENYNETDILIKADDYIKIRTPQYKVAMVTIREYGYKWDNPYWVKKITQFTEATEDRIAEIANKLLAEGYGVRFMIDNYKRVQDLAINGYFKQENTRWIFYNSKFELLQIVLNWEDDLYEEAKRIPDARWLKGTGMLVPLKSYKEVLDFADLYDYKISPAAKEEIEIKMNEIEKTKINVVEKEQFDKNKKLKEILNSKSDLLDDLKDN
ncbi:hypothetical protein KQI68_06425 [Peptoniphilus sp. MSJ-1]|uniref:Uncharacterized protein n=1 Tax=Peptoniphilus ovalis TaxID=2841503 RepID=A0ABS6FH19_9FIRM|nr:hypothetical protein [Peptoniphilus ovalis]MBU5669472.1 hypothetical protein [Peptoniphilus ovalis]